jgi:hypothetical protein
MLDIINLALPFFGLIFIGFACGKLRQIPDAGLAWMNFFILYVALPALFFHILAKTPFERLAQVDFIKATTSATASAFLLAFSIGLIFRRRIADATLAAVGGGFGNVGYMGPGLALATFGQEAAVPVALIFSFDALLVFALVPILMAFGGASKGGILRALVDVVRSIALNPLLIAAALGPRRSLPLRASRCARPPPAVSLRVSRPVRPVRTRRHGGAASRRRRPPRSSPADPHQTGRPPHPGVRAASRVRFVQPCLDRHSGSTRRAAAGAHRLRVRTPLRPLDRAGLQPRSPRHLGLRGDAYGRDVAGESTNPMTQVD